ncbi:CRISPR-associated protein Cas1 [Desulfonatronospira thiodismutans ASO3-1]|uniref:CRISPR-associated endonuclease Cas1 n=1 Tax=Desulfonatronospira thiodismutans ASO3-1 TaxID=555779 RepID=D6SNR9_9BACT|nr:type I-F CRISPR-associated endonuclease Cas1f [Desulfonatronospira thiodismutans]EFI34395.1 CRISPR-associated protein Cas1 [Desulfonatronospira thiodismutans ASO3-1]
MQNKQSNRRPMAVMLSKRANVFYFEHVRIMQKKDRVVYLTETGGGDVLQFVNIPDKNTAFVLMGKGSSITDAAARKLAESNVLIGFAGSGGSPLFGAMDFTFLLPQDEYRPTEYAQNWMKMWLDEEKRLSLAKKFLEKRVEWGEKHWPSLSLNWPREASDILRESIHSAEQANDLLLSEAKFAKSLYACLASRYKIDEFTRDPGQKKGETKAQLINSYLDHGNYIAYGYAAVTLHGLGIPFFLPVLHGKTRRGALVFDVADLFKDWVVMPVAFDCGSRKVKNSEFRALIIQQAHERSLLDMLFQFLSDLAKKD